MSYTQEMIAGFGVPICSKNFSDEDFDLWYDRTKIKGASGYYQTVIHGQMAWQDIHESEYWLAVERTLVSSCSEWNRDGGRSTARLYLGFEGEETFKLDMIELVHERGWEMGSAGYFVAVYGH